jgi:sortase (surface protein transpeptidase)
MPAIWREGVGVEPTAAGSAPPATGFEDRGTHRDTCLPTQHYLACAKLPPNRAACSGCYGTLAVQLLPPFFALPCWFLYNAEAMNAITHRLLAVLLLSSFTLAACQGYGPVSPLLVVEKALLNGSSGSGQQPAAGLATAAETASATPAVAESTVTSTVTVAEAGTVPAAAGVVAALATADYYSSAMPVALAIPAVDLQAQVTPMGWETALIDGQVTTRWVVPEQTLGWAVNSAGAGESGNVIIVGHQAVGAALFRPVALGEVTVGQEIQLQAADGVTYRYQVTEVSDPIPAIGASPDELALAAKYLAPATDARLTLVSGWPADTTTHRVFVVAAYAGVQP